MSDYDGLRADSASNFRPGEFLAEPWTPQAVNDVTLAFPAQIENLIPDPKDIPDEFWDGNAWTEFASYWFNYGLPADTKAFMRTGIDGATAFRHLQAIKGSYQPKHQHKLAALGFLASRWMYGVEAASKDKVWGEIPEIEDEETPA